MVSARMETSSSSLMSCSAGVSASTWASSSSSVRISMASFRTDDRTVIDPFFRADSMSARQSFIWAVKNVFRFIRSHCRRLAIHPLLDDVTA